jgi:hypothetical protein
MAATASRMLCSEVASTVMTKGRAALSSLGSWRTASRLMCLAARMLARAAMMPGLVLDAEAEVIGALLPEDTAGLVGVETGVGEGADTLRAAAADFAGDAHEVADDGHSGWDGAAPRQ